MKPPPTDTNAMKRCGMICSSRLADACICIFFFFFTNGSSTLNSPAHTRTMANRLRLIELEKLFHQSKMAIRRFTAPSCHGNSYTHTATGKHSLPASQTAILFYGPGWFLPLLVQLLPNRPVARTRNWSSRKINEMEMRKLIFPSAMAHFWR